VIQEARKRKTRFFFENRGAFLAILKDDIRKAIKQAEKKGLIPVFRLNGTSDIAWEKYGVIQEFPNVQFYDYTAILGRKVSNLTNYHLTFSKKESNDMDVRLAASNGMNVAVVFSTKKGKEMPSKYIGRQVFNGDDSDLRFLDPKGVVVGLYAKGKAKKDFSGFVVQV